MWSKLKKQVESLFADNIGVEIKCAAYGPKRSWGTGTDGTGRYYILLDKEVVWDENSYTTMYNIRSISDLIREYINTPLEEIMTKDFQDKYNLIDVLIASDRRFGKGKLFAWYMSGSRSLIAGKIIGRRINNDIK